MVRVIVDISVPAHTVPQVRAALRASAFPRTVQGQFFLTHTSGGCEGLATGGKAVWTACSVCIEAPSVEYEGFGVALRQVRQAIVEAAAAGGLELMMVPATAQVDDKYLRLPDVLNVVPADSDLDGLS